MGRLERIKEIKLLLEDNKQELLTAYKNSNWKHARDIISDSEELDIELDSLQSFDEESDQMVGGNF